MDDAPTGLYGWIQSNDGRSTALFAGFLIAVQAIAAMVLFLPLAVIDAGHAPFLGWGGYFLRYAPLVLAASVAWFFWQMFWHIEAVKRAVGFQFVDDASEPRLCRLIEPLILTLGLPVPFVGVIETEARNAFACGIARKKAVVVVTRGLIDDLSDAELACVLAHELSHIKNGDIRLMAAANIFMDALGRLHKNNPLKFTPIHVVMSIAVPAILPLTLAGGLVAHLALRAGQVSRLLIASAREFMADAGAVQLTQNPAAMASALVKVEHRWQVDGTRRGDDAMMIAGDTEGENATHPTMTQRIAALARTTGSMVFNAPGALPQSAWDNSKTLSEARAAALLRQLPKAAVLPRVRAGSNENALGLTTGGMVMAAITVLSLGMIHRSEASDPRAILAKFDVRPIALLLGSPIACQVEAIFDGGAACGARMSGNAYREFEGQKNTLAGWLADTSAKRRSQGFVDGDLNLATLQPVSQESDTTTGISERMKPTKLLVQSGFGWGEATSNRVRIAEANEVGCFSGITPLHDVPEGKYRVGQSYSGGGMASLQEAKGQAASMANQPVIMGSAIGEDDHLVAYVSDRELMLTAVAYNMYGLPGLRSLQAEYLTEPHQGMVARLRERLRDPAFVTRLAPVELAEYRALVRNPDHFVPCIALRHLPPGQNLL